MIYNIQALRALAAVMVVAVHLGTLLTPAGVDSRFLQPGNAGVDLFFVISGFVMVHTTMRRPVTPGGFLANRLFRVAPLYWTMTLAMFAVALVAPRLLGTTRASAVDLAKSLAFVPFDKGDGLIQPLLFPGWTLNYEMAFYAVFAAMLAGGGDGRRAARGSILALALAVAAGVLFAPRGVAARFYTDPIVAEFAFGMAVALAGPAVARIGRSAAVLLLAGGAAAIAARPWIAPDVHRAIVCGLPGAAILAGALAIERAGTAWSGRRVQLLGASSYALYLTHLFPLRAVEKAVDRAGLAHSGAAAGAAAVAGIAACVAVAVAVHRGFERPVDLALRRLMRHPRPVVDVVEPDGVAGAGPTEVPMAEPGGVAVA